MRSEAQELRDFTDALRAVLGKSPLYFDERHRITMEERFATETHTLPEHFDRKEWFLTVATSAPSTRSSFRDLSVAGAMKRRALRF